MVIIVPKRMVTAITFSVAERPKTRIIAYFGIQAMFGCAPTKI
jgi:hypothetical protein